MGKRRQYSEEFKREAVRLFVTRGEQPASAVAKSLGVAESLLYNWRKQLGDIAETAVNGRGETRDQELLRLRREVVQLRKEKEVLKKSALLLLKESER